MIWVITVLAIIAFLFFKDKGEENKRIAKQGGVKQKYGILINYILSSHPQMEVQKLNTDSITMAVIEPGVRTEFSIRHGFESVSVFWRHYSAGFGNHRLNWTFPEFQSQEEMINEIEGDIAAYEHKLLF
ncbi:hypothetical protein I215_01585 [Galbibacter marinus]|uniref:Uncharacterized protein n=1 Tax=Galbibacter marinus TaxID=555500 RepID=K2PW10_9FLAO|nr:hypothetical protein [Galbibacter marinus]EKF56865.1 hypothetical protein I215_01585 [Galbibacter marinus]